MAKMEQINFPIVRVGENIFQIQISINLYAKEAINAVCYKYTGLCFVHQELKDEIIIVTLEAKEGNSLSEQTSKQFCNDLIDQQIRFDTEQKFGHIRDLIVEEAFKPVNKNN